MHNQPIHLEVFQRHDLKVFLKREDQIHPVVSGNKFRKLKYNLQHVKAQGYKGVLTFGGAFSNHIAATAFACNEAGVPCVGVIRGEELERQPLNETLGRARDQHMILHFVSREDYRNKMTPEMMAHWEETFPGYYVLPEGGTNALAVKGCAEILDPEDHNFDVVCTAVGTGGTMAGLVAGAAGGQMVLGFPALKGDFLKHEIARLTESRHWELITDYHFGGYAKVDRSLIDFINIFKQKTGIPLDPVYTGKMMYGIAALAEKGYFEPGTRILAIHTGGLQGIKGMNEFLKRKKLPLIQ